MRLPGVAQMVATVVMLVFATACEESTVRGPTEERGHGCGFAERPDGRIVALGTAARLGLGVGLRPGVLRRVV